MVEQVISTCEIDCQTQNIENVKHELSSIAIDNSSSHRKRDRIYRISSVK
jgi:hypothetical protein